MPDKIEGRVWATIKQDRKIISEKVRKYPLMDSTAYPFVKEIVGLSRAVGKVAAAARSPLILRFAGATGVLQRKQSLHQIHQTDGFKEAR